MRSSLLRAWSRHGMLAVRSGAAAVTSGQRLGLRSVSLGPAPPACAQRRLVLGDMTSPLTHRVCRPARPAAGLAAAIVLVLGSAISAAATPQRAAAATSLVPANHAASAWQCRHASSRGSGGLQEWPARIRARVAVQFALDDIGGYRQRRAEALARFVTVQAEEVLEQGVARSLENMNAADRKVVHDTVNEIDGVSTVSEGVDPDRRVVIVPDAAAE